MGIAFIIVMVGELSGDELLLILHIYNMTQTRALNTWP